MLTFSCILSHWARPNRSLTMRFFETVTLTPKLPKCTSTKSLRCIKVFCGLHSSTVCFVSSAKNKAGYHTLWIHLSCLAHHLLCIFSSLSHTRTFLPPFLSCYSSSPPPLIHKVCLLCVAPGSISTFLSLFLFPCVNPPQIPIALQAEYLCFLLFFFLPLVSYALR